MFLGFLLDSARKFREDKKCRKLRDSNETSSQTGDFEVCLMIDRHFLVVCVGTGHVIPDSESNQTDTIEPNQSSTKLISLNRTKVIPMQGIELMNLKNIRWLSHWRYPSVIRTYEILFYGDLGLFCVCYTLSLMSKWYLICEVRRLIVDTMLGISRVEFRLMRFSIQKKLWRHPFENRLQLIKEPITLFRSKK